MLEHVYAPSLRDSAQVELRYGRWEKKEAKLDADPIDRRVPWLVHENAWELNQALRTMRQLSKEHGCVEQFMQFLISYTATGCISRQELVSMVRSVLFCGQFHELARFIKVPAMLLNIKAQHMVCGILIVSYLRTDTLCTRFWICVLPQVRKPLNCWNE